MKNLIFDVEVIINSWTKSSSSEATDRLLHRSLNPLVKRWVSASSLSALANRAGAAFRAAGVESRDVEERVLPQLLDDLLSAVDVLSNYGFEQRSLYQLSRSFESAQIVSAARSLSGQQICFVTENKQFDTMGELLALSPAEALAWVQAPDVPFASDRPLPFVDLACQQAELRSHIERRIEHVLRQGQYIMGPEVKELEGRLAAYTGSKHCITVASGTEALLISLMALNIGPGDEVITTPFTFAATAEMIVLLGAKPVFVDIEADTCNIDASLIEAKITPRTRAIMPVSLYGQTGDMDEINSIAARNGDIPVIEDAAQSFGATYRGRKSCNLSTFGCTSFFPSKPLGCYGDGGAIFTNDEALAQACREIRVHGQSARYTHTRLGVGGRMDTLQCAVVLAKLVRLDWEIEQRLCIGARYNEALDRVGVSRVVQRTDRTSVYGQYTVLCPDRPKVQQRLRDVGIPTAVHYPIPLNEQPAYMVHCCTDCTPVAKHLAQRVMSLPMSADLTEGDQQRVVAELRLAMQSPC
jgi:UDP-2-acetamido-2-deoxy-ribo-hexuluronate aminotransferase